MDIETYEKAGKLIADIKEGKRSLDALTDIVNSSVLVPENCSVSVKGEEGSLFVSDDIIERTLRYILSLLKNKQEDLESKLRWL